MKGELHDVFEDESEDVYCEMKPCKKQRVKMLCYTCIGCTIKYEAKNKAKFGSWMYNLGVVCTLGLGKWKWTKKVWNKTLEPYCIDAIDNIVVTGIAKFVEGLRSDNA